MPGLMSGKDEEKRQGVGQPLEESSGGCQRVDPSQKGPGKGGREGGQEKKDCRDDFLPKGTGLQCQDQGSFWLFFFCILRGRIMNT